MNILGIESSCDETAAAVVTDGWDVRSNIILSQIAQHRPYGGVVPEIASRCHVEALPSVVEDALNTASMEWADIDALAVTYGPGLASSLLVGLTGAKALALRMNKPLIGVNHLQAHVYSLFLNPEMPPDEEILPLVALLVSGGHSCLVRVDARDRCTLLGQTIDDAAGEALDKGAKLLGLGYPGGPAIEAAGEGGDPSIMERGNAPRVRSDRFTGGLDPALCFSFSGLKTALLYGLKAHPEWAEDPLRRDICAGYQEAVFAPLITGLRRAMDRVKPRAVACVGGVAKNKSLRGKLQAVASEAGLPLFLAPMAYCTDNAAMIAGLAHRVAPAENPDSLDVCPNLPLTDSLKRLA